MIGIIANIFIMYCIINKGYVDNVDIGKRQLCFLGIVSGLCFIVLIIYTCISDDHRLFYLSLCAYWLLFMALMDKISAYVFEVMEYYALIPVCLCLCELLSEMFKNRGFAAEILIGQLVFTLLYGLMAHIGLYGEGDGDILAVCGLLQAICNIDSNCISPLTEIIFINTRLFCLSFIIFIISNIKFIELKKMRMKKRIPFIPSIFVSYVLMIIL